MAANASDFLDPTVFRSCPINAGILTGIHAAILGRCRGVHTVHLLASRNRQPPDDRCHWVGTIGDGVVLQPVTID